MSNPTDVSSSASPIWPPPPSSAHPMLTVEGTTITISNERLWMVNPQIAENMRRVSYALAWVLGLIAAARLLVMVVQHFSTLLHTGFWPNALTAIGSAPGATMTYLNLAALPPLLLFLGLQTFLFAPPVIIFNKQAKSALIGHDQAETHEIKGLVVRHRSVFRWQRCSVYMVVESQPGSSSTAELLSCDLHQPENAQRVAEEIAKFLDVPCQGLSAGAKG